MLLIRPFRFQNNASRRDTNNYSLGREWDWGGEREEGGGGGVRARGEGGEVRGRTCLGNWNHEYRR